MTTLLSALFILYAAAFLLYLGYMGRYTPAGGIKAFSQQHENSIKLAGVLLILFAVALCAYLYGWERGTPTALFIFALSGLGMLVLNAVSLQWALRSAVTAMICAAVLLGLSVLL